MYNKKVLQDEGLNQHTAPTIRKEVLTPRPPPPPPKRGTQVGGGGGSKLKKIHWGSFSGPNDDFTRGWTSDTTTWGMLRERPPKEGGGYTTPSPTPDLTTLFEVIYFAKIDFFQKKKKNLLSAAGQGLEQRLATNKGPLAPMVTHIGAARPVQKGHGPPKTTKIAVCASVLPTLFEVPATHIFLYIRGK